MRCALVYRPKNSARRPEVPPSFRAADALSLTIIAFRTAVRNPPLNSNRCCLIPARQRVNPFPRTAVPLSLSQSASDFLRVRTCLSFSMFERGVVAVTLDEAAQESPFSWAALISSGLHSTRAGTALPFVCGTRSRRRRVLTVAVRRAPQGPVVGGQLRNTRLGASKPMRRAPQGCISTKVYEHA